MLGRMSEDITKVLARNLKRFMDEGPTPISQNALAKKAKVAQTGIGYMLNPETRQPTKSGKLPSPTIARVEKVARALGKETWQLLHPDPNQAPLSATERVRYQIFEESRKRMEALDTARQETPPQ